MKDHRSAGIYEMQQCLVAAVSVNINTHSAESLSLNLLREIEQKHIKKIVLDLSDVTVMESRIFMILLNTMKMAELMGGQTAFAGIQPGVAANLVDMNIEVEKLKISLDLDDAISLLVSNQLHDS